MSLIKSGHSHCIILGLCVHNCSVVSLVFRGVCVCHCVCSYLRACVCACMRVYMNSLSQDPAVTKVTEPPPTTAGQEEYNPFEEGGRRQAKPESEVGVAIEGGREDRKKE